MLIVAVKQKASKELKLAPPTHVTIINMDMDKPLIRRRAGSLLLVLGLFGLNSMHGQIYRNGYMRQIIMTKYSGSSWARNWAM